jgi:hypothetical protein
MKLFLQRITLVSLSDHPHDGFPHCNANNPLTTVSLNRRETRSTTNLQLAIREERGQIQSGAADDCEQDFKLWKEKIDGALRVA